MMKPVWLGYEHDAMKASHQYVEAKESMLLLWIDQYNKLETDIAKYEGNEAVVSGLTGQQKSLLARIRTEAERVDPDDLAPYIREFLAAHPRS